MKFLQRVQGPGHVLKSSGEVVLKRLGGTEHSGTVNASSHAPREARVEFSSSAEPCSCSPPEDTS